MMKVTVCLRNLVETHVVWSAPHDNDKELGVVAVPTVMTVR